MINLYIGEKNLPKGKRFIYDADSVIRAVKCSGTSFQRAVLYKIEKGSYYNDIMFTDRFGAQLYYTDMSTGAKTLFGLEALQDVVINCDECGTNALRMISLLDSCNCFLSFRQIALPYYRDCPIVCNEKYYNHIGDLNEFLR